MFSNTFAGIAPSSAPVFIAAQVVGGVVAVLVIKTLYPDVTPAEASDIVFPHHELATSDHETQAGLSGDGKGQVEPDPDAAQKLHFATDIDQPRGPPGHPDEGDDFPCSS